MGGAFGSMGEKRNACRVLMRKPEVKKPLGRIKCRRGFNMELKEIIWEGVE
jgi:hypothetical protein